MQKEDIEYNLSLLGKQLEELGLRRTIRLLMIGGGFMLTQIGNRLTTDDVDIQIQNIADPLLLHRKNSSSVAGMSAWLLDCRHRKYLSTMSVPTLEMGLLVPLIQAILIVSYFTVIPM